jgi:hypothetical protein
LSNSQAGNQSFNCLFSEAIDEGLSLLGDSGKKVIYYYLDNKYYIKKSDLVTKPEELSNALDKIFGVGSTFLKELILQRLYSKMGPDFPRYNPDELNFVEYVSRAKSIQSSISSGS